MRENEQLTVVFRLDDYSEWSSFELEQALTSAFREYGLPASYGVVPYGVDDIKDPAEQERRPLGDEKIAFLKEAVGSGIIEPALHGHSHQNQSDMPKKPSEFTGRPESEQRALLAEGQKMLQDWFGVPITTFIPPWNRYDEATVSALESLGFTCVSGVHDETTSPRPKDSEMRFFQASTALCDVQELVERNRNDDSYPLVVVKFHHFDFSDYSDDPRAYTTMSETRETLAWIAAQKDVTVRTFAQAVDALKDR